jgi:hypothetical protein
MFIYHGMELIKSFAIFYLFIFTNVLLKLFPKSHVYFMTHNKPFIYTTGFMIFYFLITLFSKTNTNIPPLQKLFYTFFYYILFLISIKLDMIYTIIIGICLFGFYLLDVIKSFYLYNKHPEEQFWITLDYPVKIRLIPFNKSQLPYIEFVENTLDFVIISTLIIGIYKYFK